MLSGEMPASLGGATALRVLGLSGNDVGGEVPASLTSLTRLRTLSLRGTRVRGAARSDALCAFLAALPLCDLAATPASLAHCASAAPRAPAACRLDAAAPPPAAAVTRAAVRAPATGLHIPLVGMQGHFRNVSGGRVFYGDTLDVVMPYCGETVAAVAASVAAGAFAPGRAAAAAAFLPSDPAVVATLGHKARFAAFAAAHADTFGAVVARAVAEPPAASDYPCVLKLAESAGGEGVHVLRNARDYDRALAAIGGPSAERVVQAWAPGRLMGTAHYALLRGAVLASVFYEAPRPRGLRIHRGGITGYARRDASPHSRLFEPFFQALNYTGLACVNYVVEEAPPAWRARLRRGGGSSREGGGGGGGAKVTVLEINPRVGSSLRQALGDLRHLLLTGLDALEEDAAAARATPLPP
jgi:hypothetical protein